MARLESDNLILDIKFNQFEKEWIAYEIKFLWKDEIIINDNILKRDAWWGKREYGTFMANDYEKDHLADTINKVLEENKPEYWEPIEPDCVIAIYPDMFFPFLKNHWTLVEGEEGEKYIEKEKKDDKKPEDLFTIITFIDTYNFRDCAAYSGEGISLHMIVKRSDLEQFVLDQQKEYNELLQTPKSF